MKKKTKSSLKSDVDSFRTASKNFMALNLSCGVDIFKLSNLVQNALTLLIYNITTKCNTIKTSLCLEKFNSKRTLNRTEGKEKAGVM